MVARRRARGGRSIRILVATDQWFPDVRGGVARLAAESARLLASRGHEVTVLMPRPEGPTADVAGRHLQLVRALRRGRLPHTIFDPIDTARAARNLDGEFDVLLGHNATTAVGLLAAGLRAPLVTFFHASAVLELEFLSERAGSGKDRATAQALKPALARLERKSLAGAAGVLLLSEYTRSLLARRSPAAARRAIRIPGAVDTNHFAPGDRSAARTRLGIGLDETVLFTVRRLVPRMGLEELVDAAAMLGDVPRLRLAVAGGGPLHDRLQQRSAASGGGKRVELLGRVADDDLADWYRAADLFVLPTLAYEGFGLVTIEALASGTPVVGTPVGATPELLTPLDERLLARGTTPEELSSAIRRGLELLSPELRLRCRSYAMEMFSWDNAIPAWEDALESAARAALPAPRKHAVIRAARALDERVPFDLRRVRNDTVARSREGAGWVVRTSGLPAASRRIGAERHAGILLYHNPRPEILDRHLDYLAKRHRFVPYAVIADATSTGDWSDVPPKSLALTFDDGHAGNALLLPVLDHYGAHATIFVCTGIVGTMRRFWWTVDELDPRERDRLMRVPDAERLAVLDQLAGWTPEREYSGVAQALSRDELDRLSGVVAIEAHTRLHPILPMCSDEQATDEIEGSREDIERLTGKPSFAFAYPNGRYGRRELELVKRAGFRSARTIETGWNDSGTDPFRLRVLGMPDNASLNVVAAQSTGLPRLRNLMYLS
jgi:glycosyltransferase involved in cell wall biosynthesis/peptidoglycan/xylan/chitin deacetylase (PgdA/CDA1 family)